LLRLKSLALSSLQQTIARQESRILWLAEGDAPTRFFHAHANARRCQNHIHSLQHQYQLATNEDTMVTIAFDFFNEALGIAT
jgi:hypothetical protein